METSGELLTAFRGEVGDLASPYLWSDTEIYSYMADAYRSFARLTGGIPDVSSPLTIVPIVATQMYATVSPLILRFVSAHLVSDGRDLTIVNELDRTVISGSSYGLNSFMVTDRTAGPVKYMMIGLERNQLGGKVRWVQIPTVNDSVQLSVFRLPLDTVADGDGFFTFQDIGVEHIEYLLLHMKARAYGKQDADTFDKSKRDYYKNAFRDYCLLVKAEWDRYKHKTRVVAYGGL